MRRREADRVRKRYRSEQTLVIPTESLTNQCAYRQRMAARRAREGIGSGTVEDLAGIILELNSAAYRFTCKCLELSNDVTYPLVYRLDIENSQQNC